MKKILRLLVTLLVGIFIAVPVSAHADVNDFSFESFDAKYQLTLNSSSENRVDLQVTETLVAIFPEIDQNRGIRRDIPSSSYGIYPGLIAVQSVTDEKGNPRNFEITTDTGFVSIASKPADDSFVHGRQTYVIKYRQSWVVRNYQDSPGLDEFYWDVNGTGWLQKFERVSATVTLDDKLAKIVQADRVACYQGYQGESQACDSKSASQNTFTFTSSELAAGETLTIDVPFSAGVVNTSGPQVSGTLGWYLFWIALGLLAVILLWAAYFRIFKIRSAGGDKFVVPQYLPAKEPGLLATGLIAKKMSHIMQALVLELAVTKQIEIEQVAGSDQDFILRRTSATASDPSLLATLGLSQSGSEVRVGPHASKYQSEELATALSKFVAQARKRVYGEGYFLKRVLGVPALVFVVSLAIFAVWAFAAAMLDSVSEAGFVAAPIIAFAPFSFVYWLLLSKRAYSAKGSEVVNYLKGLELYIRLAEKDRLDFLQSPKGADLKPSELAGRQVLKLYEAVLPWAALLGMQKAWSKVMSDLYEKDQSPVWFVGTSFTSNAFDNLNSSLTSSLAVSASSGSSGDGSSGGGGGGGGGGGI